jgi:lipopolysaccharide transport system permease protein
MNSVARNPISRVHSVLGRYLLALVDTRFRLLGSLIRNRELIVQLTRRELALRFRGSTLGMAWAVITPLLTALTYTFVLSVVFKSRWGGAANSGPFDYAIMLLTGLALYGIFAECIGRAPNLVVGNPNYVSRVIFPLEILPIVAVFSASVNAAISLAIALLANLCLKGGLHPTIVFLPLLFIPYILFLVSMNLVLAAFGVYLRDLSQLVSLVTTLTLFLTPIFYPISAVPAAFRRFMWINPLTFIVEEGRSVLILGQAPNFIGIALYTLLASIALIAGHWLFRRLRPGFADVL